MMASSSSSQQRWHIRHSTDYELRLRLHGTTSSSSHGRLPSRVLEIRRNFYIRQLSGEYHQLGSMAHITFPFPLLQLQSPNVFQLSVVCLLSSLQLCTADCEYLASNIKDFTVQLAAGDYSWNHFRVIADIDHIQIGSFPRNPVWRGEIYYYEPAVTVFDETLFLGAVAARTKVVSESVIERLRKGRFVNRNEDLGDCSVCYEKLRGEKKVIRMPCDHVYHESCIVPWLKKSNSCPLCRSPV